MIIDSTGYPAEHLPVSTEQHETYGLVHEYAIGRYTIKVPEGFYVRSQNTYFDGIAVREVKWPETMKADDGFEQLWDEHLTKLKNRAARSLKNPKFNVTKSKMNNYTLYTSFYYDHTGEPYELVTQEIYRPKINVHKLVNYDTHGVWFYNSGLVTDKDTLEASLNALIEDYEPYAHPGQAEIQSGSFHMKRGVVKRPFDKNESMAAGFFRRDDNGRFGINIQTETRYQRTDIKKYREFPNSFSQLRSYSKTKPKKIRYAKRTIANYPGYEYIIHYKEQKNPEYRDGSFRAWYSNTHYKNMYPEVSFHTVLYATKDFNRQVDIWDFILNSFSKIAHQEN